MQGAQSELGADVDIEDMSHHLSSTHRGSQLRWTTVDKAGFVIVSTVRIVRCLLRDGVHI